MSEHDTDDPGMHVPFVLAAHELSRVILANLEPKLGAVIAGSIRTGAGRLSIVVTASERANWTATFHPTDGSAAVPLAFVGTPHTDVQRTGMAMLECVGELIARAVNGMDYDERAVLSHLLAQGQNFVRVEISFAATWSLELFAVDQGGQAVRFAAFTEKVEAH